LHPFDFKAALLAKHAQHVVLIHFPIALFIAGVTFDFLAQWTKRQFLAAAAYCNLAAAVITVPVLITGVLAWQWQLEGQRLKGIFLLHLILGGASSLPIWIVFLVHLRAQRKLGGILPRYRLPIGAVGVALVRILERREWAGTMGLSRPETGGERRMRKNLEIRPTWSSTIRRAERRIGRASYVYLIAMERL